MNLKLKETLAHLLDWANGANLTFAEMNLTWLNGTDGSGLYACRWGKVVTLVIVNPTKLEVGNNVIAQLPAGWRPKTTVSDVLIIPTWSGTPTNSLSLRASVVASGDVTIYNYRTSAISGDTNQNGALTYVVGG